MNAVATHNLSKRFGTFTAVDAVNISIHKGERYALIGPNGAGKTTLLKLLVGLLIPSSGTAEIFGNEVSKRPLQAKEQFGYISDDASAYEFLTGREFLILTGRLRNMKGQELQKRIAELTPLFPISDILSRPMSEYSRGSKQKISFLASMLTKPKLLIIDEPIVGLDPESIDIMGNTILSYAKEGNTVLFVTHILSFAQKYASRAGIMQKGKITKEVQVPHASLDRLL